jgi:hypothetical protein
VDSGHVFFLNVTATFRMVFIITITYSLHVSPPTGHLQAEYIYIYTDYFLRRYIYILVSCFGETCSGYVIVELS